MKIVLISLTTMNISSFGTRTLSAFLKKNGHEVRVIMLPGIPKYQRDNKGFLFGNFDYPEHIVNQVIDLAKGSDLIGMSLMTQNFSAAVKLTKALKNNYTTPVLWGGVHPTVKPEDALRHADMICIGEGEEAVCELADRLADNKPFHDVPNIWFRRNQKVIRNPVRPLIQDLDSLPYLDYGPENHFTRDLVKDRIVPFDEHQFENSLARVPYFNNQVLLSFMFFTTRGCPYRCSYCVNDFYRRLYGTKGYVRKMSVNRIVEELSSIIKHHPCIEEIEFCDDNFALRPVVEIEEFSRQYRDKIGLPFQLLMSPQDIIEEKIAPLVEAGLVFVETGIQSSAEVSEKLYERKVHEEKLLQAAATLKKYQGKMAPPCYHVILDSPFEKTADTLKTFDLSLKLPRPFWFKRSSLVAFPGTKVYQRYQDAGLIKDEVAEIYNKVLEMPSTSYINFLFLLNSQNYPIPLLRFLSRQRMIVIFNRPSLVKFFELTETGIRVSSKLLRWIKTIARGDIKSVSKRISMIGKVKGGKTLSSRPPAF